MTEPATPGLLYLSKDYILAALAGAGAVTLWMLRRIGALESSRVGRDEFNATVSGLRHRIDDGNRSTHERLDRVLERLAEPPCAPNPHPRGRD